MTCGDRAARSTHRVERATRGVPPKAYDPPHALAELRAEAAQLLEGVEYTLLLTGEARPDLIYRVKSPTDGFTFAIEYEITVE